MAEIKEFYFFKYYYGKNKLEMTETDEKYFNLKNKLAIKIFWPQALWKFRITKSEQKIFSYHKLFFKITKITNNKVTIEGMSSWMATSGP